MKRLKNNKGITIIALVVTIVVILILAGITVSTLTGSNGILLQTQKEKDAITEKSDYAENKITRYEEALSKSIPDIELKRESGTNYIKIYDVTVINYTGNVDNYEYYIKKKEESKDMYKKVTTDDMKEMLEKGLIHDTFYDIKIIAKNGDEQVLSRYTTIKTKELVCANLIMKTEDNQNYTQDVWTNKNITTSLEQREDGTTSSYASIEGSAQTINSTNSDSLVSMSGITQIRVQTTDGINTVSKDYKLKIDRMAPTLTITSKGIADQYPETLTLQAKENEVQINYIELPNGTRIKGEGKSIFTTTYNVTKNGPITCKVADTFGNEGEQTFQVENVINFETEWTIAEANTEIYIPITGNVDVYIDYGDGIKADVTSNNPTHIYANAGTYTMKISGKCNEWGISYIQKNDDKYNDYNEKVIKNITGIKKWGCLENSYYGFFDCSNIASTIPEPHQKSFKNITKFNNSFSGCKGLSGNIPQELFTNCPNITNFSYTFSGCSNLTGNIPETLFEQNSKVTSFTGTFKNCSNLTGSIPENLFKNCTEVTGFGSRFVWEGTFYGCSNLTGNIPENLFENCTKVVAFSSVFEGCSNLTGSIPEKLFANCPNAKYFGGVFWRCKNLTGTIPENLFANCPEATEFYFVFNSCTGLTGSIPENLFANCTKTTGLRDAFMGCTNLTGAIPEKLFSNCANVTTFEGTFDGCKGLNEPIPEKLFETNTKVTNFQRTFFSCDGLTGEIPEKLFANCPEVTNFNSTFWRCKKLTGSIPENLFANNAKVTNFNGTFVECENLTGNIPEKLFVNCPNVVSFGGSDRKENSISYNGTFNGCISLTGNAPELWKRDNVTSSYYCFYKTNFDNKDDIPDDWK